MTCSTEHQLCSQLSPKCLPEVAHKLHIPVKNNCLGYSMQAYNLPEKQVSNMRRIVALMACNKMCHFRKSIHYHKNTIMTMFSAWQSKHKIKTNIFPRCGRSR